MYTLIAATQVSALSLVNSVSYHFYHYKEKKKVITVTSTETSPFNFCVSPRRAESSVDFPHPTWPTIATSEPVGILSEILETKTKLNSNHLRR